MTVQVEGQDEGSGNGDVGQGTQIADLRGQIDKLRNECAGYRTERNASLRREAALSQVLSKHNIEFDIVRADLGGFKIESGKAVGELEYEPAKVSKKEPDVSGAGNPTLTMEDVAKMSESQINANWEAVSLAMSNGGIG